MKVTGVATQVRTSSFYIMTYPACVYQQFGIARGKNAEQIQMTVLRGDYCSKGRIICGIGCKIMKSTYDVDLMPLRYFLQSIAISLPSL